MADTTHTRGGMSDFVNRLIRATLYADAYADECHRFSMERWFREIMVLKPTGAITVRRPTREAANG